MAGYALEDPLDGALVVTLDQLPVWSLDEHLLDTPPDPECVSWTHDRDWRAVRGAYPTEAAARHAHTAWCPPPRVGPGC